VIVLIAGASGVGKSELARRLAIRCGVPLVEVDDIVEALRAVSTPEQLPALHRWDTDPAARALPPEGIVGLQLAVAAELVPAIDAVIDNHLATTAPVVLEGDQLLPVNRPGVHALVLHEPDGVQIVANYRTREPAEGDQAERALVSRLHGELLAERATAIGVPVLAARPWADVVDRALDALGLSDQLTKRIVSG
jgi:2-phosphoglycerate kinase